MKLTPSKQEKKLKALLDKSQKILLLTHERFDPDAISSMLLVYYLIKLYWKNKDIHMILQEKYYTWPALSELEMKNIGKRRNTPKENVDLSKYDLVIVVDADRVSRTLSLYCGKGTIAIIDHHDAPITKAPAVIINESRSSATEQIYLSFKRILPNKFEPDREIAHLTQIGIIADTGRFLYAKVKNDTYRIMSEISELSKMNQEVLWKNLVNMDVNSVVILGEAIKNMRVKNNVCYSHLSKKFIREHNATPEQIESGVKLNFLSNISRYIKGVDWGFVTFPISEKEWKISFRSVGKTMNVEELARKLGGGGHYNASSTNIKVNSQKEAIKKVLALAF